MSEAVVLIACVLGLAIGTYFVAKSPDFWFGLITHVAKEMMPIIAKRMPPDQEAAWRECEKRNGKWNHRKKRCE